MPAPLNLTGQTFGRLVVIERVLLELANGGAPA